MRKSVKLGALGCLSVVCLACVFSGCASTKEARAFNTLELSDEDLNKARAFAHYCQGMLFENEEGPQNPETLEQFLLAVELDPYGKSAYPKVAYGLMMNKQAEKSIDLLLAVIKRLPGRVEPHFHLANAYNYAGKTELAIRHYLKILDLDSSKTRIYLNLATMYFDDGMDEKALSILDKGLVKANAPEAVRKFCYNRGMQFIEDGEGNRSMPCFELVARHSETKRSELYHLMGNLYENLKLSDEAVQSYELACAEERPLAQSYIRLASLRTRHDMKLAIDTLQEGVRILPENVYILLALAQMYSIEDDHLNAMKVYARASALVTKQADIELNPSFYLYYGAACERAGYYADAEALFESCIQDYPESHEVLNYLAYMWAEQGRNLHEALAYVDRALAMEPENGAYLDTRGWVFFRQGKYDEAVKDIEKASEYYPRDATISHHLGDAWSALGDRGRALRHWTESYRFDSENDAVATRLEANGVDLDAIENTSAAPEPAIADSTAMPGAELTQTPELNLSAPVHEEPASMRERVPAEGSPANSAAD